MHDASTQREALPRFLATEVERRHAQPFEAQGPLRRARLPRLAPILRVGSLLGVLWLASAQAEAGEPTLTVPGDGWRTVTTSEHALATIEHERTGTRVSLLRIEYASTPDAGGPTAEEVVDTWLNELTASDPRVTLVRDELQAVGGRITRQVVVTFSNRLGVMAGLPFTSQRSEDAGLMNTYVLTCEGPDAQRDAVLAACGAAQGAVRSDASP